MVEAQEEVPPDEETGGEDHELSHHEFLATLALVGSSGLPEPEYQVASFSVSHAAGTDLISCIVISEINSSFLVAVPGKAWHRATSQRLLPSKALTKPVSLAVAACSFDDRLHQLDQVFSRVWVGFLNPTMEGDVNLPEDPEDVSISFWSEDGSQEVLPFAEALVSIADDKFAFLSAVSGDQELADDRLSQLEKSVADIKEGLAALLAHNPSAQAPRPKPAPAAPRAKSQGAPSVLPKPAPVSGLAKELDQSVVQAALAAGVEQSHIEEMSRLLKKKTGKVTDLPNRKPKKVDVLGDSEDDELIPDSGQKAEETLPSDPVQAALVKLTAIVDHLQPKRKSKTLEEVLEDQGGLESGSSSMSGFGTHRRQAAVLKALKQSLVEEPGELYGAIERLMLADFGSREAMPGEPQREGTYRGWLEHRSRIPNIAPTVRISWSVAGALDCLKAGRPQEAKARLALLLGALDQVACDRGSWLIASEVLLEQPPPFSNFAKHSPPDYQEAPHSRLLDSRWVDALMYRVKELDEYQERRAKLGKRGKQIEDVSEVDPKKKGGGKKGGGGRGSSSTETA